MQNVKTLENLSDRFFVSTWRNVSYA